MYQTAYQAHYSPPKNRTKGVQMAKTFQSPSNKKNGRMATLDSMRDSSQPFSSYMNQQKAAQDRASEHTRKAPMATLSAAPTHTKFDFTKAVEYNKAKFPTNIYDRPEQRRFNLISTKSYKKINNGQKINA